MKRKKRPKEIWAMKIENHHDFGYYTHMHSVYFKVNILANYKKVQRKGWRYSSEVVCGGPRLNPPQIK